jgi:CP family cyanate transporter-like MFS transporter
VTLAGLGQGTFAMALLMMNLRTRTTHGAGVLAGFSQGVGYAGAGVAPLLFGVLRDATGSWTVSFAMLGVCLLIMLTGGLMINGPRCLEDDATPSPPPSGAPAPGTRAAVGRQQESIPRGPTDGG